MQNKVYKTFNDLEFKNDIPTKSIRAELKFSNNFSISVIKWLGIYGYVNAPYECACLYAGELYPLEGWNDSVKNGCTEKEVTKIMKVIQDINE